jgi:hypothetical protein
VDRGSGLTTLVSRYLRLKSELLFPLEEVVQIAHATMFILSNNIIRLHDDQLNEVGKCTCMSYESATKNKNRSIHSVFDHFSSFNLLLLFVLYFPIPINLNSFFPFDK